MVKGDICSICNHEHYVERHHPDGKKKVEFLWCRDEDIVSDIVMRKEFNIPEQREEMKLWINARRSEGKTIYGGPRMVHIHPDNWIPLCANCHSMVHRRGLSLDEIRELYKEDNSFYNRLIHSMESRIGSYKIQIMKAQIKHSMKWEKYLDSRVGIVCACGKKHRKHHAISNCVYEYNLGGMRDWSEKSWDIINNMPENWMDEQRKSQ